MTEKWDAAAVFMAVCISLVGYWVLLVVLMTASFSLPLGGKSMHYQIKTFKTHLIFMILICIYKVLRPFWKLSLNDTIWRSDVLCDIYTRFEVFALTTIIFPVYFSYCKTRFYREILPHNEMEYCWLKLASHVGFIIMLLAVVLVSPKPFIENGYKGCYVWDQKILILNSALVIWMITMYIWIINIFRRNHEGLQMMLDVIPMLKQHIVVNRWFCIFLFATTLAVFLFQSITVHTQCSEAQNYNEGICSENVLVGLTLLDALVNNIIMFYTIYGCPCSGDSEELGLRRPSFSRYALSERSEAYLAAQQQQPRHSQQLQCGSGEHSSSTDQSESEDEEHSSDVHLIELPSLPIVRIKARVLRENDYLIPYIVSKRQCVEEPLPGSHVIRDIDSLMDQIQDGEAPRQVKHRPKVQLVQYPTKGSRGQHPNVLRMRIENLREPGRTKEEIHHSAIGIEEMGTRPNPSGDEEIAPTNHDASNHALNYPRKIVIRHHRKVQTGCAPREQNVQSRQREPQNPLSAHLEFLQRPSRSRSRTVRDSLDSRDSLGILPDTSHHTTQIRWLMSMMHSNNASKC